MSLLLESLWGSVAPMRPEGRQAISPRELCVTVLGFVKILYPLHSDCRETSLNLCIFV